MPLRSDRLVRLSAYLLIAGSALLSACQPSGNSSESSPSATLFKSKCRSCHALPKPESKSGEQWAAILDKHGTRLQLSDEQRRMILKQLTGLPPTDSI